MKMPRLPKLNYLGFTIRSPTEVVHLEYNPKSLPPKPSEDWTRFVCISDTHSHSFYVPDGDVLLHSGDLTNRGQEKEFQKIVDWLCTLPHKVKIIIAGNHDLALHADWYQENYEGFHPIMQDTTVILDMFKSSKALASGIVYLQDEEYEFQVKEDGRIWSVYGSPWSPEFFNWAFNYNRETAHELISKFTKSDILLTHGPAFRIFDRTKHGEAVGCEAITRFLPKLRPRLHVAGHIHEAHGAHIHSWDPSNGFAAPVVQNDRVVEDGAEESEPDECINIADDGLERTVFVNAANYPLGKHSWRDGKRVPFGGPGFQPVVVDLKD